MELRQLDIFRILAHELNFTTRRTKGHCVQSNVTVQIREIERELEFHSLNDWASRCGLRPRAEAVAICGENSAFDGRGGHGVRRRRAPRGTLFIGSPESVLTYRMPPVSANISIRLPEVDLVFRASGTAELVPQLERGELDLGLVIDDAFSDPHLHIEALCPEPLTLLAASGPSPSNPLQADTSKLMRSGVSAHGRWLCLPVQTGKGARAGTGETKGHYGIHERGNHQAVCSIGGWESLVSRQSSRNPKLPQENWCHCPGRHPT